MIPAEFSRAQSFTLAFRFDLAAQSQNIVRTEDLLIGGL